MSIELSQRVGRLETETLQRLESLERRIRELEAAKRQPAQTGLQGDKNGRSVDAGVNG